MGVEVKSGGEGVIVADRGCNDGYPVSSCSS